MGIVHSTPHRGSRDHKQLGLHVTFTTYITGARTHATGLHPPRALLCLPPSRFIARTHPCNRPLQSPPSTGLALPSSLSTSEARWPLPLSPTPSIFSCWWSWPPLLLPRTAAWLLLGALCSSSVERSAVWEETTSPICGCTMFRGTASTSPLEGTQSLRRLGEQEQHPLRLRADALVFIFVMNCWLANEAICVYVQVVLHRARARHASKCVPSSSGHWDGGNEHQLFQLRYVPKQKWVRGTLPIPFLTSTGNSCPRKILLDRLCLSFFLTTLS